MSTVETLEPREVFHYFEEIAAIPHGSGHTGAISDYLAAFAEKRGLSYRQDEMGNVVIRKPATPGYEDQPGVILQGHMDMVCEKIRECPLDMEKDGLLLCTDGEKLWADGTTLGGDDGIAVAYALAVLDSTTIPHPPLEVILTVDEEIGLLGAAGLDMSDIRGRRLINLDNEEEGMFLTSCAGGLSLNSEVPLSTGLAEGVVCDIKVIDCRGGHSGTEIDKGRANSNQLMGRVLMNLQRVTTCYIIELAGGNKDNAIPRFTEGEVLLGDVEAAGEVIRSLQEEIRAEYAVTDPDITLVLEPHQTQKREAVTRQDTGKTAHILMNMPNGVQAMSADVEDLVETSLNMGVMKVEQREEGAVLRMSASVRSSKESAKNYLTDRCEAFVEQAGGNCTRTGAYPGWDYRKESLLRDTFVRKYRELFGKEPVCEGLHAGVECGLFVGKVPDMDCISLGPDMSGVHTAQETLSVPSTQRNWKLLLAVLADKQK